MLINPHLEGNPFYWDAGEVGVLLCHGLTATTAEVRPLAELLYGNGFSIAAPLLPGHGTAPHLLNSVKWQDWVAEIEVSYEKIAEKCEQVYVGGESTGALLALYLASEHPEISGILAFAPVLKLNLSLSQKILFSLLSPVVPFIRKENPNSNSLWQGYPVNPLKSVNQLLHLQNEITRKLHRITQPLLIVQGRLDKTVHPDSPEIIRKAVNSKQVEIHWMEKSSHVVILDSELNTVASITLDFINHTRIKPQH